MWTAFYADEGLTLKVALPGDFDANGAVNSADYNAWADGFGTSYGSDGFLLWQRNFNGTSGPVVGVPEPAGAAFAAMVGLCVSQFKRRRPKN
jgi:hypothetical protein